MTLDNLFEDESARALQKELDEYATALLKEIAALDRRLSKKLTQRVKTVEILGGGKRGRKFGKIAIVYVENQPLYERAASALRASPEWRTLPPDPTVSAFYRSVYKLVSEFRYPGSVEKKNEAEW